MAEFKVGVLLPRSSLYPNLSIDLVSGLKAGLKTMETDVKLYYENIGFGEKEATIYDKAEKLLLTEDVQLVIAYLDHSEAFKLEPLFSGLNRLLLILDPGGHVPLDWTSSPFCYTISLQAAFGSYLTGKLAAREGSLKPIFATSFYEGGYLQSFSYQKGAQNGGSQIQSHLIVPFIREDFNITSIYKTLEEYKPDSILAQFSAEAGETFLKEFINTGLQTQLRFYSSPFMLEETWLATLPYPFDGIKGYVSWLYDLPISANQLFLEKTNTETGKKGNIFSMLGWETALFLNCIYLILKANQNDIKQSLSQLEHISFDSPRGKLHIHKDTHHLIGPMYITEIIRTEDDTCKLLLLEADSSVSDQFEEYIINKPEGMFSKWTNTYLCI